MTNKTQELDETGRASIVRDVDKSLDAAYGNMFKETLHEIALQSRLLIGAHQSAISYIPLYPGQRFPEGDSHSFVFQKI